jgi:hypothetical protein
MNNGELTAQVARALTTRFKSRAEILFDHGKAQSDGVDKVGKIHAWYGDALKRDSRLADLDIAVVLPRSNRVLLLIEVEESSTSAKTLLGDVFAAVLAEHFTFQGKRELETGDWTMLIVLAQAATQGKLIPFLSEKLANAKSLHSGKIIIDTFGDTSDLEKKLTQHIEQALSRQSEI